MNACKTRLCLLLVAAALLLPAGAARGGAIFFAGQWKDGVFTPDKSAKGPCYTIRYSAISAKIDAASSAVKIEETVTGPESGTVRTLCVIPLPAGADGKSATVSAGASAEEAKPLAAMFLSAEEARQVYEAVAKATSLPAVAALTGRPALLVEDFPLPAKTVLTVSFTQPITREGGVCFFGCPMPSAALARGPVARLSLTASLTGDKPLRAVFSPSHAATVQRDGLGKAQVRVQADEWSGRDDFRLCYVADEDDLGLRVLTYRPDDKEDGYFLLIGNPTGSAQARKAVPKDVLLALDTSGSMRGEKIEQARSAIEYCLDHLNAADRFNVVTFGTEVAGFRDGPVEASKANVLAAREFVEEAVARGLTNISGALAKGLAGQAAPGRMRIMIFLTDGTPTAGELVPDKIVEKLAEMNASGTRIFVMGLGHDVNAHLLDKLAEKTDGSCEYVEPEADIDVKIAALYDRLANPVLSNVTVAFGELRPTAVFPAKLPALFAGSEIMVAGRYAKGGQHTVSVSGSLAGEAIAYTCKADFPDKPTVATAEFVAPLWAARKIGFLLREIRLNGENKELIDEVVRLATKFGIVTEYTSFLAAAGRLMPGTSGGIGGVAAEKAAADEVTGLLREARAQQAGQWAVNQAVNEQALQNRQVAGAEANLYKDRRGKMVAADTIRQVGGQAFYLRDGQWVQADAAGDRKARRVALFSKEYFDLLRANPDFARAQSIGWNVEMNVGAERIAVEKDGKTKDETMKAPPAPVQNEQRQQVPNQQFRNQQINQQPNQVKQIEKREQQ